MSNEPLDSENKPIINPLAYGGQGFNFENHVQTMMTLIMLTDGVPPIFETGVIDSITLQAREEGLFTDDLMVYCTDTVDSKKKKLIIQCKSTISFTLSDVNYRDSIKKIWKDFNSEETTTDDVFVIATQSISKTDIVDLIEAIEFSHISKTYDEFESKISSSQKKQEKIGFINQIVREEIGLESIGDGKFLAFLKRLYVLHYDVGKSYGVNYSLIKSLLSARGIINPNNIYARIRDYILNRNPRSAILDRQAFLRDMPDLFQEFNNLRTEALGKTELEKFIDDNKQNIELLQAYLFGGWCEDYQGDKEFIEKITKIPYHKWIQKLQYQVSINTNQPLNHKNGYWWHENRIDLWDDVAPLVFDNHLNALINAAINIISESDPIFEVNKEDRLVIVDLKPRTNYSPNLKRGILELFALIENKNENLHNCKVNEILNTKDNLVYNCLLNADWKLWASLNSYFNLIAECAPLSFLSASQDLIDTKTEVFQELSNQSIGGIFPVDLMSGTINSFEILSWKEKYITQASFLLANISIFELKYNGFKSSIDSLINIFLPQRLNTNASWNYRKSIIEGISKQNPSVAWEFCSRLLPTVTNLSSPNRKPQFIPVENKPENYYKKKGTEYYEQIDFIVSVIIENKLVPISKLLSLVQLSKHLSAESKKMIFNHIGNLNIIDVNDNDRYELYINILIEKNWIENRSNKKSIQYTEMLPAINQLLKKTEPDNLIDKYKCFFEDNSTIPFLKSKEIDFKQKADKEQIFKIEKLNEICSEFGIDGIITMVQKTRNYHNIAYSFAKSDLCNLNEFLPNGFCHEIESVKQFFTILLYRKSIESIDIIENFDLTKWSNKHQIKFYSSIRFSAKVFNKINEFEEKYQRMFWETGNTNMINSDVHIEEILDRMIQFDLIGKAIYIVSNTSHLKSEFPYKYAYEVLENNLKGDGTFFSENWSDISNILTKLQNSGDKLKVEKMIDLEFLYLPIVLDIGNRKVPVFANQMTKNSKLFADVFKAYQVRHYKKENELSDKENNLIKLLMKLFFDWRGLPGQTSKTEFSIEVFDKFLDDIKGFLNNEDVYKSALFYIGKGFVNAPKDSDGLWIHKHAAQVLDRAESTELRNGFENALLNSRGIYAVDEEGKGEIERANKYEEKSNSLVQNGFNRLANVMKYLSIFYFKSADRIKEQYSLSENDNQEAYGER